MYNQNNHNEPLPRLELDKNRYRVKQCPCGRSNKDGKFVPFKGFDNKGYCHSCGKTFLPDIKKDGSTQNFSPSSRLRNAEPLSKPISYIPVEILEESLTSYEKNQFVIFLVNLFGIEITEKLIDSYYIGTSSHWKGANVFWQIDIEGRVRTGKIMLYHSKTGKRVKQPFSHIAWAHKFLGKLNGYNLRQCFFGEHLIKDSTKPVAIVESEKTAVIASVFLPQFVWLATGSITNLKQEKCDVLLGKYIVLFPDLNAFKEWKTKAELLQSRLSDTRFSVSELLNSKASEEDKKHGLDLADYLIRFNWQDFLSDTNEPWIENNDSKVIPDIANVRKIEDTTDNNLTSPICIKNEISLQLLKQHQKSFKELETYFNTMTLPTDSIRLNHWSTVTNIRAFVESHLATMKTYCGKEIFEPYQNRLIALKNVLNSKMQH